jgi:hypothetical protein
MKKTTLRLALLSGLAAISLIGCSSNKDATSYAAVSGDPTPDLQGFVERPIDVDRHLAYMRNTDWRAASDDLGRMMHYDHPSRLTPFPTVYTSGMPR